MCAIDRNGQGIIEAQSPVVAVSPISQSIIKAQSPVSAVSPISQSIIKEQSPVGAVSPISCFPVFRIRTILLRTDQVPCTVQ